MLQCCGYTAIPSCGHTALPSAIQPYSHKSMQPQLHIHIPDKPSKITITSYIGHVWKRIVQSWKRSPINVLKTKPRLIHHPVFSLQAETKVLDGPKIHFRADWRGVQRSKHQNTNTPKHPLINLKKEDSFFFSGLRGRRTSVFSKFRVEKRTHGPW